VRHLGCGVVHFVIPTNYPKGTCFSALRSTTYMRAPILDTTLPAIISSVRGGADKSLARPGRKQATATKLGIFSTYSPRSSIHFVDRCCNFCKPLKKNSEGCPSYQVSAAAMTSASDEKWRLFNGFFSPGNRL